MLRKLVVYREDADAWKAEAQPVLGQVAEELSSWLMDATAIRALAARVSSYCAADGIELITASREGVRATIHNLGRDVIIWNVTDGCLPYHGSYIPASVALLNIPFFGNSPFIQILGQDKAKLYCICAGFSIPVPRTVLAGADGCGIGEPFLSSEYFVKPNSLGNSIGVRRNARHPDIASALSAAQALAKSHAGNWVTARSGGVL